MCRTVVLLVVLGGMVCLEGSRPGFSVAADALAPEAADILRRIEETRTATKPFRLRGMMKRANSAAEQTLPFEVESEGLRYRVLSGDAKRSVAIFDGEQLLCYDGRDSAVVTTPDRRSASNLAFDPRALGIATGLFSDLTLIESIAYRLGKDVALARSKDDPAAPESVIIELTDRFDQRIRLDVQPRSPYRVYFYSKTIPLAEGHGTFTRYVTEAEYWPDESDNWLPRRLVMYTQPNGDPTRRTDETVVELERPEFIAEFDPAVWTTKGLSMPFGQPLADLRIKRRIGYWDGSKLVEEVPVQTPLP